MPHTKFARRNFSRRSVAQWGNLRPTVYIVFRVRKRSKSKTISVTGYGLRVMGKHRFGGAFLYEKKT